MGRYIDWDDLVLRYPSIDKVGGAAEVGSAWIGYIENQVDGLLAPSYTVPFSNNNETVKDLCIELTYIRVGNLKVEEAESMRDNFMERIKRLKVGEESLLTNSGDVIGMVGDTVWSSTEDYNSVFGMSPTTSFEVDSSQVYSEEVARGNYE